MFGFGRASVAGVDIGSSAVKAVALKRSGTDRWRLVACASEPVPHGAIVDGGIVEPEAVAASVRRVLSHSGFRGADVVTSLAGSAVIAKQVTMPMMTDDELAGAIEWEAGHYIPFDIQDVTLDFLPLKTTVDATGRSSRDVLLVAAKRQRVAEYADVVARAGRRVVVVDLDAFALQNAYEANYGQSPSVVVLINAGASAINVNIVSGERSLFTRDVSVGGDAYTEAIARALNVPFELAERAKRGVPVPGVPTDEVDRILHQITDDIVLELQKTFDFYRASAESDTIDRILISGGSAATRGLVEAISDRFGAAVDLFDPFSRIDISPALAADAAAMASTAAVAVGLALRRQGDR